VVQRGPARTAQEGSKPRYAVAELQPLLQPLLAALFAAFRAPESGENEYLMKAVMRVIAYVGPEARMWLAVQAVIRAAQRSLIRVCFTRGVRA
jgi:hypothetical protein